MVWSLMHQYMVLFFSSNIYKHNFKNVLLKSIRSSCMYMNRSPYVNNNLSRVRQKLSCWIAKTGAYNGIRYRNRRDYSFKFLSAIRTKSLLEVDPYWTVWWDVVDRLASTVRECTETPNDPSRYILKKKKTPIQLPISVSFCWLTFLSK